METVGNTTELVTSAVSVMENQCPPAMRSKLSMSLKKGKEKKAQETTTLQDCTNQDTGGFLFLCPPPNAKRQVKVLFLLKFKLALNGLLRNFRDRTLLQPDNPVPKNLLELHDADLICKWLCRFLLETRKTDGSQYPPASLKSLV